MDDYQIIPEPVTRSYALRVVVERSPEGWVAYCPALLTQGALVWGESQKNALQNLERLLERLGVPKIPVLITL